MKELLLEKALDWILFALRLPLPMVPMFHGLDLQTWQIIVVGKARSHIVIIISCDARKVYSNIFPVCPCLFSFFYKPYLTPL